MNEPARKRAAVETYARNESILRRTARRYSLCADDADDALQRGLEIFLCKAPTEDPRELIKWMQTVVKREALAVRYERVRDLAGPAAARSAAEEDWTALLPADSAGPAERVERREEIARSREALLALRPQELRVLTLRAEGYSYVEISELTGYSQTKVNRCLSEGRERYRQLVARSEDGRRCVELRPLLSAFCDGEARAEEVAQVREHLRACVHCRSTLRAYRAAPAAAAALAPVLPLDRSLWERARDAISELAARLGGDAGEPATQVAGGGAGGLGVAGLAKVAAICVGTAGGAAACVAGGIVPAPLGLGADGERPQQLERRLAELPPPAADPQAEPAPAAAPPEPQAEPEREPKRDRSAPAAAPAESEPVAEPEPVSSSTEYVPPPAPEPAPEPAPVVSSGGGSPAGEFGP
ncbi:MAG TPA: sigma-70 family RNA polymerase sigma factor [Solirubrobacterales bacterium]|nr:sigma-70 family RNA polymerase sigma factor [Solirubrobacterales bacterium]